MRLYKQKNLFCGNCVSINRYDYTMVEKCLVSKGGVAVKTRSAQVQSLIDLQGHLNKGRVSIGYDWVNTHIV